MPSMQNPLTHLSKFQGYRGTSCELCIPGFYRDVNDLLTGPLGSCSRCPCNNNEVSCTLGPESRVICECLPDYEGPNCQYRRK